MSWQEDKSEALLLYGRVFDLHRNGIYATISEGNSKSHYQNQNHSHYHNHDHNHDQTPGPPPRPPSRPHFAFRACLRAGHLAVFGLLRRCPQRQLCPASGTRYSASGICSLIKHLVSFFTKICQYPIPSIHGNLRPVASTQYPVRGASTQYLIPDTGI